MTVENSIGRLKQHARMSDPCDGTEDDLNYEMNVVAGLVNLDLMMTLHRRSPKMRKRFCGQRKGGSDVATPIYNNHCVFDVLYAYACCFGFFHFYIHVCRLFIINCFVIYTYVLKNVIHIYYNRLPIISIICSVSDKGTFSTSGLVICSYSINTATIPKRAYSRQIKSRSSLQRRSSRTN